MREAAKISGVLQSFAPPFLGVAARAICCKMPTPILAGYPQKELSEVREIPAIISRLLSESNALKSMSHTNLSK